MKATKIMAVMAFMILAMPMAMADFAYTPVLVGVTVSKTFTVTMNGQGATASDPTHPGTATEVVWFNSTTGTVAYVNATIVGANDQVGPYPQCDTPIAVFKNTGTIPLTLNITLNNTLSGMVFFYNSSLTTDSVTGTPEPEITSIIDTAPSSFVTGLGLNNETDLCVWANFTSVAGGETATVLNYTSQ